MLKRIKKRKKEMVRLLFIPVVLRFKGREPVHLPDDYPGFDHGR